MSKRQHRYTAFDARLYDLLEMPKELRMIITDYVDPCNERLYQPYIAHEWEIFFTGLREFCWHCRCCDAQVRIPAPLP